jgi:hypothetical protein
MPIGRRLAFVFARLLPKQQQHVQPDDETGSPENRGNRADQEQPIAIGAPSSDNASQAEEREHRRAEQRYWKWSIALTLLTIALTSAGIYVANSALKASWRAVDEARRQAEIARFSLIASDRPWLQVTSFRPDILRVKDSIVGISSTVAIKNVGHSPALNVQIMTAILPSSGGGDLKFPEEGVCQTLRRKPYNIFSNVIFPGEENVIDSAQSSFVIALEDVLKAQGIMNDAQVNQYYGTYLLLMGCIVYQSAATAPIQHSTSFGFILDRKCPERPFGCALEIMQEEDIPGDQLQVRTPFKGNTAD